MNDKNRLIYGKGTMMKAATLLKAGGGRAGLAVMIYALCAAGLRAEEPAAPATPPEQFNAGTRQLRDGKLAAAEALLQNAVAGQDARVQPPALYESGLGAGGGRGGDIEAGQGRQRPGDPDPCQQPDRRGRGGGPAD